jgi:two-component system CheB/CheR fusion protein
LSETHGADHRAPSVVVGVGASAGGLEALRALLSSASADPAVAWVVALHLDPERPSALADILSRATSVPVVEAIDGLSLEGGRVYVIPPGAAPSRFDGVISLDATRRTLPPSVVDRLLSTLAEAFGDRAVGVVLSGTGTDGAAGMRAVKAAGGLTIAQDPTTAAHDGMPRASQVAGAVDLVLAPAEIPGAVASWAARRGSTLDPEAEQPLLKRMVDALLRVTGHDFSGYKSATFQRRVARRMGVLRLERTDAYAERLDADEGEVRALMEDLLIGVTRFFRDPGVWDAFAERVVEPLVASREPPHPIRVWVPACSSGEEVYTVAILFLEALQRRNSRVPLQIFGTDIDRSALEQARHGLYGHDVVECVRPDRLERWFLQTRDGWRVREVVRESCLFSMHDVLRDPPFSRLDVATCRNLLIYLGPAHQDRVLRTLHYGLRPGGYLLLGPSEDVDRPELFRSLDRGARIYRRMEGSTSNLPRVSYGATLRAMASADPVAAPKARSWRDELEAALLARFTPPAVVVDTHGHILHFHGRTGRFLQPPAGAPTLDVVQMAHTALRGELRTALYRARTDEEVVREGLRVELDDGESAFLDLVVRRLPGDDPGFLVVFRERPEPVRVLAPAGGAEAPSVVQSLQDELGATRRRLHETVEALESSNEELQAANEELLSTVQELQSANEELTTSKEELQSVNEELETVNDELKHKVDQLDRAKADLENLLRSTDIATIFLDRSRDILWFTPAARRLYRLSDADIGRPLDDIAPRIAANPGEDVERVMGSGEPTLRVVRAADGRRSYRLAVHPYFAPDGGLDGTVLTFVDVTDLEEARSRLESLAAIVEGSEDAILRKSVSGMIQSWNAGAEQIYGYAADEVIGQDIELLVPDERRGESRVLCERIARGETVAPFETVRVRKDGQRIHVSVRFSPVRDREGRIVAISAVARDITDRVKARRELEEAHAALDRRVRERTAALAAANAELVRERGLLQTILQTAGDGIAVTDIQGRQTILNESARRILGVRGEAEIASKRWTIQTLDGRLVPPGENPTARALRGQATLGFPLRILREDGTYTDVIDSSVPVRDDEGHVVAAVTTFSDISEMQKAKEDLATARERLEAAVAERTAELARVVEELRVGTERFHAVLQGSPLVVFNQDRDLRYTWIHNAVVDPPSGIEGRTDEEVWERPEEAEALTRTKRGVLETGRSARVELQVTVGGQPLWWDLVVTASRDANGEIVGVTGAAMDVTARKQAEIALRKSEERLTRARRLEALGRLAGGIAHDFNNLLTAILGYTEVLERRLGDSPLATHAGHIRDAATRAASLTSQLLAFSRRQATAPRLVDLAERLRASDTIVRGLLPPGIELAISAQEALWPVRIDASQLEQVVLNLVVNARDAMPEGGRLTLEATNVVFSGDAGPAQSRIGEWVRLAAADTGVGMDAETLARCFEPFFTTKPAGQGTGLGLATVWGVVEQAGGFVLVDSAPGRGSRFEVYLPRAFGRPAEESEHPAGSDVRGGDETVLVAEDEPRIRELAGLTLGALGYRVLLARNGKEAVELARETDRIDIVVSDVVMPEMNGPETVDRIREVHPDAAVLLVSGYADQPVAEGIPFLPKPFTPATLAARVRELLDLKPRPPS